jgi:hypothetical protein
MNVKGRFVEQDTYPECTQFVTTDVTLEEGETKTATITLTKVIKEGREQFQLCVYDGDVPGNCPEENT